MSEFTLYTFTFMSRAERIVWCLDELGIEYDIIKLDPFKGEIFTDEFTRLNPMRKMPVLIHHRADGDKVLIESLAIMEYLNRFAKGNLRPTTDDDLYRYDRAIFFGATELEAYLWVANQSTILRGIYHWPDKTEKECARLAKKAMSEVSGWLTETNYIAGNEFSLADIYYFQLVRWAQRYGAELPAHVERYLSRLSQRPAMPEGFV